MAAQLKLRKFMHAKTAVEERKPFRIALDEVKVSQENKSQLIDAF